jgi:hypothetical protein
MYGRLKTYHLYMKKFELLFFTVAKKCVSTAWHVKQLSLFSAQTVSSKCLFSSYRYSSSSPPLGWCTNVKNINVKTRYIFKSKIVVFSLFCIEDIYVKTKQWPLAPNSRKWQITRANVSNASHIFPEMTFGECGRVWRVRHGILANLANF